ncbi:MAG: cysT, partial [Proteobacteria bacterium]|nr:cysT [Pseudomonadota bacterium]
THRVLPGFPLALGYTLIYLILIVLIPLSAVFLKSATLNSGSSSGRSSARHG